MSSSDSRTVYRGISRREKAGWLFGLTAPQAVGAVVLLLPPVWALGSGAYAAAAGLVGISLAGLALLIVPVRGRPAHRWLLHLGQHQLGVATGWSRWRAQAATGTPVEPGEPDLPGVLTRLQFPDGPPHRDRGRIALVHDTVAGRWGATARLTHRGIGLSSNQVRDLLAARLGNLLLSMGQRGVVDRLSIYVRAVPDDGSEYACYREQYQRPDAPQIAIDNDEELSRRLGATAVRNEVFVHVSASEDALRKPAARAGGGTAGRAHVLYRALDGLEEPLARLGADRIDWLDGQGLAAAIRTGFNPAAQSVLTQQQLRGQAAGPPWAAAGPTEAPSPPVRSYQHDGYTTVAYTLITPAAGTTFGSLAPILAAPSATGERRTLAAHYEIASSSKAARDVQEERYRRGVLRDVKSRGGFAATAADARSASGAARQEQSVAAGHGVVSAAYAVSLTVPPGRDVDDAAAKLENQVGGEFNLLRLELAQDTGMVAAVLPVGIGLPSRKGPV